MLLGNGSEFFLSLFTLYSSVWVASVDVAF